MSTTIAPKRIYIIRHGEKLGDPANDSDSVLDLSIRGAARAAALPSLFIPAYPQLSCDLTTNSGTWIAQYGSQTISGPLPRFSTPSFIFAAAEGTNSNRPVETITPLAVASGLSVDAKIADKNYACLITILQESKYADSIVLICWHHGNIPALAEALGVAQPPTWDGTVFDRVWEIAYDPAGPTFLDQPQQLLFGDSEV